MRTPVARAMALPTAAVRGVGEVPIVPPAAAVANAIARATGVRMTRMPMTPERVLAALERAQPENADF